MTLKYTKVPGLSTWKRDSSVFGAKRADDPVLVRIDQLVEEYAKADPMNKPAWALPLCDLFLTLNFWVHSHHQGKKYTRDERLDPIMALFEATVLDLQILFQVNSAPAVATKMREHFGAAMGPHGVHADHAMRMVPFSQDQLVLGRLRFRSGKAWQMAWWDDTGALDYGLAESSRTYFCILRGGTPGSKNYSGFVMTLNREIFMLKHDLDASNGGKVKNRFHSSYTDGGPTAMAGTILIEKGVVKAVRMDSGHYQPGMHNLGGFLMALRMYGVPLDKVELYSYNNTAMGSAAQFLASNKTWEVYESGLQSAIKRRADLGYRDPVTT